jgi:hypothetical protein
MVVFCLQLENKKRIEEKKSKTSNDKDILAKMMKLKAKYGKDITDILSEDVSFKSDDSHRHRRKHQDTGRRRNQSRSRSTSPNMHRKKGTELIIGLPVFNTFIILFLYLRYF